MTDLFDDGDGGTTLRPTTKDLARAAGVSRATVDRVLNDRDGVKPRTVAKVHAAIRDIGFVRNIAAANLATGRTYRFLFVLPSSGDQFLAEIERHIVEARGAFSADRVATSVRHVDQNDPSRIAELLGSLTRDGVDGVAIMAPEFPQVRDAIVRLEERGVFVLPFISNQASDADPWVGIDNGAAGATAGTLMGRFLHRGSGALAVIADRIVSRDSMERRSGFDAVVGTGFPLLRVLPSLETYGDEARTRRIVTEAFGTCPDIVGVYVLSSEARVPLSVIREVPVRTPVVVVAHERTPYTVAALLDGTLDAVITQDPGHLVRSAVRKLRAMADRRATLTSQERIRIEILLKTNL